MRAGKLLMVSSALAAVLAAGAARADVVISDKATANMSCSAGVCSPTAAKAVLNATDLANMLASGDVKVTTGAGATNIVVKDGFSWTAASRLTLDGIQSVEFDKPVTVAGTGAVTITTNDGGSGGDLLFGDKGNLTFWDTNSSLIINGNSYTLVKDIATLASDIATNPSGFYAFANNYDASVDGTYSSAPIPGTLKGTFEGLGHAITNMKILSSSYAVGFFGAAQAATIRDIRLRKIDINGTSPIAGGLLGEGDQVVIADCFASGSINIGDGSAVVGGLVGKSLSSSGTIIRSHAHVSVNAPSATYVGGLMGSSGFVISLSSATGSVRAGNNSSVGGLIGTMFGATVDRSYANGSARAGENAAVGGLLGLGSGEIENSYATGAVKGGDTATVGGFAGEIGDSGISSSYSIGHVGGAKSGSSGGLLGVGGVPLTSDYWDIDTTGKGRRKGCGNSNCGRGAKGLTTEQFQSGLPAGFDPNVWAQKRTVNGGYPFLLASPPK